MKPFTKWGIVGLAAVVFARVVPAMADTGAVRQPTQSEKANLAQMYRGLPMVFEANVGQTAPQIRFLSRGLGYRLDLTCRQATLTLGGGRNGEGRTIPPANLIMALEGGREQPSMSGLGELPGKANYFIGNDPRKWFTGVPLFQGVRYAEVYPDIDLAFYGDQRSLEFDFVLRSGAKPGQIRLGFRGARHLSVSPDGDLIISVGSGEVVQHKPVVYQDIEGRRHFVSASFVLLGRDTVGFRVAAYDTHHPLVIDPTLSYSSYLGGVGTDAANAIAVDKNGKVYVAGTTSGDFPVVNPVQGTVGAAPNDAFVAKFDPMQSGTASLIYSTYLGGSGDDQAFGIAVDSSGAAYVTGGTSSSDFPNVHSVEPYGGGYDAFVTKLDPTGSSIVFSTWLGGSANDGGYGIAVDSSANVYICGNTASSDFPVAYPFQGTYRGGAWDAFLSKLSYNATSSKLSFVYSTFLGGSGSDRALAIAVDGSGNAYVAGVTDSPDFPTLNAIQAGLAGSQNGFLTKVAFSGSALSLVYSTYLGGSGSDQINGIAVDATGDAYVTGSTTSTDFPTKVPFQAANRGGGDAFVTKVNPLGTVLLYSTYVGGSGADSGTCIAVDGGGNAYVAGSTTSADFPLANPLTNSTVAPDAFVTKLTSSGALMAYSTHLGGNASDVANGIAVDSAGDAYIAGTTASTDYPTASPYQSSIGGGASDAFMTELSTPTGVCSLACGASAPSAGTAGYPVSFTASVTPTSCATVTYDWNFGDGSPDGTTLNASHIYTATGTYTWVFTATDSGGNFCSQSGQIAIGSCLLTCAVTAPATAAAGTPVAFAATVTTSGGCVNPVTYDWNFGDGTPDSTDQNPSHTYFRAGTFVWTLTSSSDGIQCRRSGNIVITGPLNCSASASPVTGPAPLSVHFFDTVGGGYPPYTYAWDFGDGSTSTVQNPSHTYSQLTGGTYRATFTVTDSQEKTCSDGHLVITVAPQCILTCSASSQATGTAGSPVAFAASATLSNCPGSILYAWAFGDGTTSSAQYPTHVYATAGTYTWTMTASAAGLKCMRSGSVAVGVKPITLAWMKNLDNPFRIVVHGTNLQYGVQVYINGVQWGNLTWKNTYKLILKGGNSLQTVVPMNVPTQFRFVNPDGSELTVIWQWP